MSLDRGDVLLAARPVRWKIGTSLWILLVVAGCGVLSFFGWLCAGALAQTPRVWRAVACWLVATAALWVVVVILIASTPAGGDAPQPWDGIGMGLWLAVWLGGTAHALVLCRPVLRSRVLRQDALRQAVADYERQTSLTRQPDAQHVGYEPARPESGQSSDAGDGRL